MLPMRLAHPSDPSSNRGKNGVILAPWAACVLAAGILVSPARVLAETATPDGSVAPQAPVASPSQQAPGPSDPAEAGDGYADNDPSALSDFQQPLAPYGTWVDDPTYGTIWVPNSSAVGPDFAPYQTAGHWATSDTGDWLWVSDYEWGYIPFHYGRWIWAGTSWGWIPGRTYAPAWVSWRVGDGGYIGWAPLPPTWYWSRGYAVGLSTRPFAPYCFVPTSHVFHNNLSSYVIHDRGLVNTAGASTHLYRPVGTSGGARSYRPASPSYVAAHVSPAAGVRARSASDPRAVAFSTHGSTAVARRAFAASAPMRSPRAADAWHTNYAYGAQRSYQGPTYHQAPTHQGPSAYRGGPSFQYVQPHQVGPSYHQTHSYPSYRPAQSYRAPSGGFSGRPSGGYSVHSSGGHFSGGHFSGSPSPSSHRSGGRASGGGHRR